MSHVSVVIPTYNGSKYLIQTIESVLLQTFRDFELIVVDDGSDEDIEGLLLSYRDSIHYLRIENSGPAAARNAGIKLSKGEYIALLDHDDVWSPDNLYNKIRLLENHPDCAMVYSYPELIDSSGHAIPQEYPSCFPSGAVFEDFLLRNRIVTFSCVLFRKEIFERVGLLDDRREITCCDDYDMWLRITDVSPIVFSSDRSVYYRIHENNLVRNHDVSINSHMTIFRESLKNRKSIASISPKRLRNIVREHTYAKYCDYAYKYFYDKNNYIKCLKFLGICLLLKPMNLNNWKYFVICLLPSAIINKMRLIKQKLEHKQ